MIARRLFDFSAGLRCRLIHRRPGEPYLERYWLGRRGGATWYLHRFVAADVDEPVHDHPWHWSCALVLCGGYREERVTRLSLARGWVGRARRMFPGRLNRLAPGRFHRIVEARPETWTLFCHGPISADGWGFLERTRTAGPTGPVPALLFVNRLDLGSTVEWWTKAKPGRDAGREPFGGLSDDDAGVSGAPGTGRCADKRAPHQRGGGCGGRGSGG